MYYDSIHNLPQYYWNKVNETQDYKYLIIKGAKMSNKINLKKVWDSIYEEYITEFGFSDNFLGYMKLKKAAGELMAKAYLTNNTSLLSIANAKFKKAIAMIEGSKGSSILNTSAHLTKFMGVPIRLKETTVAEFYSYLRLAQTNQNG